MTMDQVIGENVHTLMWQRHIKRPEMCEALAVSTSSLSKKMRGQVAWSAADIAAAARVLEVDPGRLFVAGAGFEPATSGSRARRGLRLVEPWTRGQVRVVVPWSRASVLEPEAAATEYAVAA